MFKYELGTEVKSSITDFKGTITSRAEHLNGCNRYWIEPKVGKDGKRREDGAWHDEQELIVTGKPKVKKNNDDTRGGFSSPIK